MLEKRGLIEEISTYILPRYVSQGTEDSKRSVYPGLLHCFEIKLRDVEFRYDEA